MGFIQIIELRTSKFEEIQRLGDEFDSNIGDESKVRRIVLCRDHDDPDHYYNVVFFDSHEEAMANSDLPVTQEFAGKLATLVDGPPTFHNLDIVEER
jgi:hypothetical protein